LYASPNIIREIKSRRMGWGGHVAHMEEMRSAVFLLENLKRRDHFENPGVDGKIRELILGTSVPGYIGYNA